MTRGLMWMLGLALLLSGCGDDDEARPSAPAAEAPAVEAPVAEEAPADNPDAEEACAKILIVSHAEAEPRPPDVVRTKEEARTRIEDLWTRIEAGASFEDLARSESDGRSTGARGGLAGTHARSDWPALHADIVDPLYALGVGQVSRPVDAVYGWVLVRRCAAEWLHIRHILIRYAGARNAGEGTTRSRDEAELLANALSIEAGTDGVDFGDLARERSEDGSAEDGGDLGRLGLGVLVPSVEEAAVAIQPGQLTGVVESPFGFHVIQRVE